MDDETAKIEQAVLQLCLERVKQETDRFNSIQNRATALLAFDGALLALVALVGAVLKPPAGSIIDNIGAPGGLPASALAALGLWVVLMVVSIETLIVSVWPLRSPMIPVENFTPDTLWDKPDKMRRLIKAVTGVAAGESRINTVRVWWFKVGVIALGAGLAVLLAGLTLAVLA